MITDVSRSPPDIYRLWSTVRSRSARNCLRSMWGPEAARVKEIGLRHEASTRVPDRSEFSYRDAVAGHNEVSPDTTASITCALSLRSSR